MARCVFSMFAVISSEVEPFFKIGHVQHQRRSYRKVWCLHPWTYLQVDLIKAMSNFHGIETGPSLQEAASNCLLQTVEKSSE